MMHHKHWRKQAFQATSLIAVVLLLLIMFTSAAWFIMFPDGPNPPAVVGFEQTLRQNIARWDEHRPASYRYVVSRQCECPAEESQPYIVTENRGQKSARFLVTVESSGGEFLDRPPEPRWISDIFNELRAASRNAATVEARYHDRYGFPESATIQLGPADSTMHYSIRDFEVLEYQQQ